MKDLAAAAIAAVAGIVVALLDRRTDDTGIIAGILLATSGLLAFAFPQRPWLVALATVAPLVVPALVLEGNAGVLLALLFACAGAYAGSLVRTSSRRGAHA